jgi:hypothetical protein
LGPHARHLESTVWREHYGLSTELYAFRVTSFSSAIKKTS